MRNNPWNPPLASCHPGLSVQSPTTTTAKAGRGGVLEQAKNPTVDPRPTGCSVSEYPLWAVMFAHKFEKCMTGPMGMRVKVPSDGPQGFIPLFYTREQAVAWAGGEEQVVALTPNN